MRSKPGWRLVRTPIGAALAMLLATGPAAAAPRVGPPARDLAATGLYAAPGSDAIDPRNLPYAPQYPLWSDGAAKRRWIRLPPGTTIDARNPDAWVFPVGTRVWKEFSFGGRRVETRLMEALPGGVWRFSSYAWNAEGTAAVRVPDEGVRGVVEIAPGRRHDIPGVRDCRACHQGRRVEVLGFGALQLSPDRDPGAPHAEAPPPGAVDLPGLAARGLLRGVPRSRAARAPRVDTPDPVARAALGYLHANCGSCHNPAGDLASRGLFLQYPVGGAPEPPAVASTRDRPGRFRIPGVPPGGSWMLRPGDPDHSSVAWRMATRDPVRQMPPLGTKLADADAVALVRRWIRDSLDPKKPRRRHHEPENDRRRDPGPDPAGRGPGRPGRRRRAVRAAACPGEGVREGGRPR